MDRCALFVDAGYLLADGAMAVHGTRHREAVAWDYPGLLQLLANLSRERTGLPLLRCYWYEATVEGRRTPEHDVLADIPGLKLRLGRIRPGRREGVDAQVHRDLMSLARNNAVCDAVVVSGDEDLAQVVGDAQDLGIRVTVMQIAADGGWSTSRALRQECDDLIEIGGGQLRQLVTLTTATPDPGVPVGNGQHQSAGNGHSRGNGVVSLANGSHQPSQPSLQPPQQAGGRSTAAHARPSQPALPPQPSPPPSPQSSPTPPSYTTYGSETQPAAQQPPSPQPAPPQPAPTPTPAPPPSVAPAAQSGPPSSSQYAPGGSSSPGQYSSSGPSSPGQYSSGGSSSSSQYASGGASSSSQYSSGGAYSPSQLGPYTGPQPAPVPAQTGGTTTLAEAVKAAHKEGHDFGDSVARDAPALWLEAVLARKPRMPSDLEARLLQGSSLPIDFLLHDEVRHALRRGFWDALERARR
ncbi:NYN domain-containing protein [Microbispora sp. NPDC049125]|uniref:NYN domain-containing protein n=1 Tax=Microbispora sp. NPDC049125 TaxID=3154929 RepID=UPI003467EACB